ncbi:hypothetical protein GC176_03010 [bacterium]|nr:hypothetical protein [bacterium]
MSSPFAVFRRHQKALTVILTGLAMFAFIILGAVDLGGSGGPMGGGSGTILIPLLSAAVFAGAFWIWGLQDGKGAQDAMTGAIVGVLIGLVPIVMASRQSGIATAAGTITERELFELRRERSLANEIVMRAFQQRENAFNFMLQQYQFGGSTAREVVFKYVLNHEARERGIAVSNEYIRNFLDEVSDGRLTREKFNQMRTALQIGETEVFDILRDELEANLAYQIVSPVSARMPEQYWQDFEKLNVRYTIEASAVPVKPFAEKVGKPSDEELRTLFDEFKNRFPAGGEPGFYQPDKVRLAWLQTDFEKIEQEVGEISEEELKTRYEERKEAFYKIETLPDLDTKDANEPEAPAADTEKPASGENKSTDTGKPDAEKVSDSPADKPEAPSDAEKPAATDKATDAQSAGTDSDQEDDEEEATADGQAPDAAATAEAPTPADAQKPAEAKEPADEAGKSVAADGDKAAEKETAAPAEKPAADASETGGVKYRPFEDVRDELRDLLLREKTLKLQREKMTAAIDAVRTWRTKYDEVRTEIDSAASSFRRENPDASDADVKSHVADLTKKLNAAASEIAKLATQYAEKSGLMYVETDLISQQELLDSDEYKIGSAREPLENIAPTAQFTEPDTVATLAFRGATREFFPDEAEGQFDDSRYVYWLTEKLAAHEPTFDEPGVREQVEAAWRARLGAPKAEERAKKLAEIVTAAIGEKSMPEAIADQTVTGEKDGSQVSVITSIPFTWLRQSFQGMQMNPFMGPQPTVEFGVIPGIDGADDNFMRKVSQMKVGDLQVIPNGDRSTWYVVHLKSRSPAGASDPQLSVLRQQFIQEDAPFSPVYSRLASAESQNVGQRWFADFMAQNGVDLATVDFYQ